MEKAHGKSRTKIYRIWSGMKSRATNPTHPRFADYGGRGIRVCDEWLSFENFYRDMGDPPPGGTLDRIDNDGDYCPANCRWATKTEQARNTRKNKEYKYKGKKFSSLAEVVEEFGLSYPVMEARLRLGWTLKKAIETPLKGRYLVNGVEYRMSAMSEKFGVAPKKINERMASGWTLKQALNIDPPPLRPLPGNTIFYEYKGEKWTINQIAKKTGDKPQKIRKRILMNWDMARIMGDDVQPGATAKANSLKQSGH